MGRTLDQVGWTSQPSLARSARERSHPTYGSVTDLVIRFNPALNPASSPSPSQPRASFTIPANFILPRLSVMIEIHRVMISHKFKSLMGIPLRSSTSVPLLNGQKR